MNKAQALSKVRIKRQRPYKHKVGTFALTASFRNDQIGQAVVNLIGELVKVCTQKEAARITGYSVSTISKLCRIYAFQHQ